MEAEPGAVLLQVVGVNGRHPLTQSLVSKIRSKRGEHTGQVGSSIFSGTFIFII